MKQQHAMPIVTILGVLLVTTGGVRADEALDKELRTLEKQIEKVRELKFKSPVQAEIIARPADADAHVQGYYSTKDKRLYLYDDIKGNYRQGVLIHEMVHALQDQHFELDKLHRSEFDSDAQLARAALIEGDATLTMIELLKEKQPRVAAMLETSLDKSKNLQNAFLYAQGARYVQALKKRGGWSRVDSAYRFPPSTTATILHPGERISSIDLGPGTTRGELALIEHLRKDLPPSEAHRAAEGWRADRFRENKLGSTWEIVYDTAEQAKKAGEAFARGQTIRHPKVSRQTAPVGEYLWHIGPAVHWIRIARNRLFVVDAKDERGAKALREQLEGPLRLSIRDNRNKRNVTFGQFVDAVLEADVVCLGESHNNELHHRLQLQIIKAIYARDGRLGVGLEMFQSPYQSFLDQYLAQKISESQMLEKTEYASRWGYHWLLYQPILNFCWRNNVPVAALNAPRELTRRISKVGVEKLTSKEVKQLGKIDYQVPEHRAYWYERLAKMHGQTDVPEDRKERSYQVMTTWDGYMANSAAAFFQQRGVRRMVVIAGSGHIERGFGIPNRLAKQAGKQVLTIKVVVEGDEEKPNEKAPTTDFVLTVR